MINGFKFSREDITRYMEEYCEKTPDNVYWCPILNEMIRETGLIDDKDYYYRREYFFDCMYYDDKLIQYFLAKNKLDNNEFDMLISIARRFKEQNEDILEKKLENYVKPNNFTVEELIDNYININYIKYNIK